jgi:hypothetical protein
MNQEYTLLLPYSVCNQISWCFISGPIFSFRSASIKLVNMRHKANLSKTQKAKDSNQEDTEDFSASKQLLTKYLISKLL